MNQQNLTKWLYVVAVLLIIAGAVICLLHLSASDMGLNLILTGHIVILTAILLQIKQMRDIEEQNDFMQEQTKEYKNH